MGPSPSMTNGRVAFDEAGNRVQPRPVFIPDPLGETARLELEAVENPTVPPRKVGKVLQPPARVVQAPAQGELEAPAAVSVRDMADAFIPEMAALDEPEDEYEPSSASDSAADVPVVDKEPSLTALRAEGEAFLMMD